MKKEICFRQLFNLIKNQRFGRSYGDLEFQSAFFQKMDESIEISEPSRCDMTFLDLEEYGKMSMKYNGDDYIIIGNSDNSDGSYWCYDIYKKSDVEFGKVLYKSKETNSESIVDVCYVERDGVLFCYIEETGFLFKTNKSNLVWKCFK